MSTRRTWKREARSWGTTLLLTAALILGIKAWQSQSLLPTNTASPAPRLALTTLDGERTTLAAFGDKPVLLHFWATW